MRRDIEENEVRMEREMKKEGGEKMSRIKKREKKEVEEGDKENTSK